MKLSILLDKKMPSGVQDVDIVSIWDDSRRVTRGSLFAALPGALRKGDDFVRDALAKGAVVVVAVPETVESLKAEYSSVVFIPVKDPRATFREIAARFYGLPSRKVRVLGVTGTNGKTTITYFLEAIVCAAGKRSGVVGTVNYRVGNHILPSKNTTPGFLDNQMFLADLAAEGVEYAVMEVSSHALDQGRVDLVDFRVALFTNLTGDHLDYHKTMESYFEAKSRLFTSLAPDACAVINTDDPWGKKLVGLTKARVLSYGIDHPADVHVENLDYGLQGARLTVTFPGGKMDLKTAFTGKHNVYNILAAFAAGLGEGIPPEIIKRGIESLHNVPGRLERVSAGQDFYVFIDYAHTDDGLKNVLTALQAVRHKKLIVVFGCGGDRDRSKRPRMGRVASDLADHAVVTSDNPRSEDPMSIINEIIPGFTHDRYTVEPDREKAIEQALSMAQSGDIVLLAGKGHETYQVLKDGEISFVERDIVEAWVKYKKGRA